MKPVLPYDVKLDFTITRLFSIIQAPWLCILRSSSPTTDTHFSHFKSLYTIYFFSYPVDTSLKVWGLQVERCVLCQPGTWGGRDEDPGFREAEGAKGSPGCEDLGVRPPCALSCWTSPWSAGSGEVGPDSGLRKQGGDTVTWGKVSFRSSDTAGWRAREHFPWPDVHHGAENNCSWAI